MLTKQKTMSLPLKTSDFRSQLNAAILGKRKALLEHRLYSRLRNMDDLCLFMQHHAFAVWDFMSLLKALQVRLTCVQVPWFPQGDPQVRRLVNEIVLGEESDVMPGGGAISHFELYLKAMQEAGADPSGIESFIRCLEGGGSIEEAASQTGASASVTAFLKNTFSVIEQGRVHEIAAAFTYGREDLIPELFTQLVESLDSRFPGKLSMLRYYLDRHIALDGDEHGEMGRVMVDLLCNGDPLREEQAKQAAMNALQSRLLLWDGIAAELER
jgi:Protein of unknown function (DUF3050)